MSARPLSRILRPRNPPWSANGAHEGVALQHRDALDDARDRIQAVTDQEIANELISRYRDLIHGVAEPFSRPDDHFALESVLHARGRPPLRVRGGGIDPLGPDDGEWTDLMKEHRDRLIGVAAACAAVMVSTAGLPDVTPTMQGTAFLVGADIAVTNRHVVRPPHNGLPLARRRGDDPTRANIYGDLDVRLDFAREQAGARAPEKAPRVVEVLFLAPDEASVDVAVLRISPPARAAITPLRLGEDVPEPSAHGEPEALYTVGHPGLIPVGLLDAKARAVFGNPDGTKRLSPGRQMPGSATLTLHDCSTIGGFSGAPLLSFRTHEVAGLHYYGDPAEGNRAIKPSELRRSGAGRYLGA